MHKQREYPPTLNHLSIVSSMGDLVSDFYLDNNEFGDQCMALENVINVLCRLCANNGVDVVDQLNLDKVRMLGLVKLNL